MDLIENTPFPDMFEWWDSPCPSNRYLLQGDIIELFEDDYKISNRRGAVGQLVVSNSCDIEHRNVRAILLVPIYPFDLWYKDHTRKNAKYLGKIVIDETKYDRKATFFISPLNMFGDKPLIAFVDDIRSVPYDRHIFDWQHVPGPDEDRMKIFLKEKFGFDWILCTDIKKADDKMVIEATGGGRSLSFSLSDDKTQVILSLDNGRIIDLVTRKEKGNDEVLNVVFSNHDLLLKHRICSLKPPWREQLGHRMGNLFNRISTYTPDEKEVKTWTRAYKDNNSSLVSEKAGRSVTPS